MVAAMEAVAYGEVEEEACMAAREVASVEEEPAVDGVVLMGDIAGVEAEAGTVAPSAASCT